MNDTDKTFGMQAEQVAEQYLQRQGYRILERNVRYPQGELDLVALHDETLVFCEVKSRRGGLDLQPGETIHPRKQAKLVRLAAGYLQQNPHNADRCCRFDAVLVWKTAHAWWVDIIVDAFRPGW